MTQRFGADPWALVYEDRVYLYMTGDTFRYTGSQLEPDFSNLQYNDYGNINTIRLLSSSDLVNWTEHPEVRAAGTNGLTGGSGGATNSWAPAAAYKNIGGQDKFFLYFADNANGIFVLSADTPVGPFTSPKGRTPLINRSTPNCNNVTWLFDPAVLTDDDGNDYIYFGGGVPSGGNLNNFNTNDPMPGTERVVRLGDDMISIAGTPQNLNVPFIYEDSGINKIGSTYYFSYCSNNQVHHYATRPDDFPVAAQIGKSGAIVYMTSDAPLGPYTLQKMILPNPDENLHMVDGVRHGAGANNHHAIFEFRGKFYIAYHSRILEMAMGVPSSIPREGYRITHVDEIPVNKDGSFEPIVCTRKGADQAGYFNPYDRVNAATFGCMAGLMTADNTTPGELPCMKVINIDTGDWIALYGVDFGARGAKRFTCRVTSSATGGGDNVSRVIQIKQGSPRDGKPVGYVVVEPGYSGEITVNLLKTVTGKDDLVFVFHGSGYEIEEWQFKN
jgi:arabinoxylan arabinofuranohydrolase